VTAVAPDRERQEVRALSELLAEHVRRLEGDRVSLADITNLLGTRSIAVWLLVLALPMVLPIPAPGISVLFGVPLMIVSVQLMLGYRRAWLPGTVVRRSIERSDYAAIVDRMLPAMQRLERIVRPRASWLANDWTKVPIGLICFLLATIITLPVPLGHVVPGTAICMLALGLMERDGLVIGLGLAATALALAIVTLASAGVVDAVHHWLMA
jgi:hypothetical protein